MKYLVWVNRVALVITLIYVLDFCLPYRVTQETITSAKNIISGGGRYNTSHLLLSTSGGSKIKIRKLNNQFFAEGETITIATTWVYSTRMWVEGEGESRPLGLGTIYGLLAIFPLGTLISAAGALILHKQKSLAFNLSIICVVLLLVTLFLIF